MAPGLPAEVSEGGPANRKMIRVRLFWNGRRWLGGPRNLGHLPWEGTSAAIPTKLHPSQTGLHQGLQPRLVRWPVAPPEVKPMDPTLRVNVGLGRFDPFLIEWELAKIDA
jgi:hypothetical protein